MSNKAEKINFFGPGFIQIYFSVFVAFLNSAINGYDNSLLSGIIILPGFVNDFGDVTADKNPAINGLLFSLLQTGAILMFPFIGPINDKYGRKIGMQSGSILIIVGTILEVATTQIGLFCVAAGNWIAGYFQSQILPYFGITSVRDILLFNIIGGIISLVSAIVGSALVDKFGRRPYLVYGTALYIFFFTVITILLAIYNHGLVTDPNAGPKEVGIAAFVFLNLFGIAYAICWTSINALYPVEVLSYSTRAKGMAMCQAMVNLSNIIQSWILSYGSNAYKWKFFSFFIIFNSFALVMIYFYFPETKGRTLEEIDEIFQDPHPVKKSLEKSKKLINIVEDTDKLVPQKGLILDIFKMYAISIRHSLRVSPPLTLNRLHHSDACTTAKFLSEDQRVMISRMLRVDHAGEIGANYIYKGQLAVLSSNKEVGPVIQHMWDQEKNHLSVFDSMLAENRVRPSFLRPFWEAAGFVLGVGTALLGKETAMACTEAVETVIGQHYNDQLRELLKIDSPEIDELKAVIQKFRDEELEHLNTAVDYESQKAPLHTGVTTLIKRGCHVAIAIATL
ncbi:hypothetical protein HK096_004323, partial [Nowakowskiella sp. JEL0078]